MSGRLRLLLAFLLLPLAAAARVNETGLPLLRNILTREYQEHSQMWAGVQTADGVMYFGNRGCVLAYDGATWKTLNVPDTTFVRGLALSADGVIYAGAYNQLGWFKDTPAGKVFVSLLEHVPATARNFQDIWAVVATADGICFITTRQILRWQDGRMSVYPTRTHGFPAGRQVYAVEGDELRRLGANGFATVARDPFFQTTRIAAMRDEPSGAILMSTLTEGLFLCNLGRVAPVKTEIDDVLRAEGLRDFLRLSDGGLILATASTGVIFLDRDNRFVTRIDSHTGLSSSFARAMTLDREGGIWLGHSSGLTRIEWPSAVTVFDESNGLDRSHINDIVRHNGILYVATTDGIYALREAEAGVPMSRFVLITGEGAAHAGKPLRGLFMDMLITPQGIVAAGPDGVYLVKGWSAQRMVRTPRYVLTLGISTQDPTRIYACTDDVRRIRIDPAGWRDDGIVPGIRGEVRSAIGENDGSLWISVTGQGFLHVRNPEDSTAPQIEAFPGGSRGLPRKLTEFSYVLSWRDRPFFTTDDGCFVYDPATRTFSHPTELGARLAAPIELADAGTGSPDHLWLRLFSNAPDAGPWHGRRIYRVSAGDRWEALPYAVADLINYSRIFYEEETADGRVLWISGSDLLARVTLKDAFKTTPLARPLLRGVDLHPGDQRPYRQNSVTFTFPAPTFRLLALPEYRTRLIGFEDEPGGWTSSPTRTFTNLPEGGYTFEVHARNSDGTLSEPVSFAFAILPPWWRTSWAYGGYVLLGFCAVAGVVRWRGATLRRRNLQLEQIVAARTAELSGQEAQLRRARDAAEAASRAKSSFLANMSHELRTPLNAVLGYARMLREDPTLSVLNRQRIGVIDQSGSHLLQVINDVLDLSKIEAGKLTLHPAPFDLRQFLDNVSGTFRALAFEKGLAFKTDFDAGLPPAIVADEHRLRQVLFNLLGNALKFTAQGTLTLAVRREAGDRLRFAVADTGIGISPDQLATIFQPFHQASTPPASHQGTGLGLAISQRIVELMGGTIAVESQPGRGSRFWFGFSSPAAPHTPAPRPHAVAGYAGPRRTLLVVDDEATNRDVVRGLLEPLGFVIADANDGEACLARLAAQVPDAVLLDLRMPGPDGFATARRIRAMPGLDSLPIIAISASAFEEDRHEAIAAGCNEFLPKPIQLERILEALHQHLHLEWVQRSGSDTPFPLVKPSAAVLDELYTLSQAGDVDVLRQRLAELEIAEPRAADFFRALDSLAGRYQMKRIRELLHAAKTPPA